MTSHGKIVMCNVAEISVNAEYNIEEHNLNLCTHLIYFQRDKNILNEEGILLKSFMPSFDFLVLLKENINQVSYKNLLF